MPSEKIYCLFSLCTRAGFVERVLRWSCCNPTFIVCYSLVGNNDGYTEHYASQAIFYKNIAPIWSALIRDKYHREKMQKEFAQGGYYALNIQKGLRLIVLNTTYFSTRGTGMDQEAQNELNWLEKQLALLDTTQRKALIILHIPNIPRIRISQNIPLQHLGFGRHVTLSNFCCY